MSAKTIPICWVYICEADDCKYYNNMKQNACEKWMLSDIDISLENELEAVCHNYEPKTEEQNDKT